VALHYGVPQPHCTREVVTDRAWMLRAVGAHDTSPYANNRIERHGRLKARLATQCDISLPPQVDLSVVLCHRSLRLARTTPTRSCSTKPSRPRPACIEARSLNSVPRIEPSRGRLAQQQPRSTRHRHQPRPRSIVFIPQFVYEHIGSTSDVSTNETLLPTLLPTRRQSFDQTATTHSQLGFSGGAEGNRTPDPFHAMEVLYQLSYSPAAADDDTR
jgi:hypothetical protein